SRTIGDALSQESTGKTLVHMLDLDMIVGSGGVLSHAPMRQQTALMMLDAYQPEGITMLAVDSIFMMPQLGILSTIMPDAASQVFNRDCLIKLGTSVAVIGSGKDGQSACQVTVNGASTDVPFGSVKVIPLGPGEMADVTIQPARGFDAGAGKNRPHTFQAEGGVVGLMIDARGRPLQIPADDEKRVEKLREWFGEFGLPLP
ncbi:MAG: glutamate mutase L, partial [Armatimonadota bacterium]